MAARLAALRADAAAPPIAAAEVAGLARLFAVRAPAPQALADLTALSTEIPAIAPAVARLARRLAALAARGVNLDRVTYQASHGLGTMEYYDGFVFSFTAAPPGLPPVASGGRYDALTAVLGAGRSIPAVGGVIRPGLVAELEGAA
jgi:ATP phosphoribosyltransferase regulatory subunit